MKFSENFEEKYSQVFQKIRILFNEIWQHLKVHTMFSLSLSTVAHVSMSKLFVECGEHIKYSQITS